MAARDAHKREALQDHPAFLSDRIVQILGQVESCGRQIQNTLYLSLDETGHGKD